MSDRTVRSISPVFTRGLAEETSFMALVPMDSDWPVVRDINVLKLSGCTDAASVLNWESFRPDALSDWSVIATA